MSPHRYFINKRRRRPMFRRRGHSVTRRGWITLAAIGTVALALLPTVLPKRTTWLWNATASTPIGFYHLQPIRRLYDGELVAAMPPKPIATYLARGGFLPLGVPLLKHVAALPGQTICRHGDVITIDGKQVAIALNDDHLGRPLPRWSGCKRLHQDQVFLMNSNVWDSLDGRYFGPFRTTTIIGQAIPVWLPSTVRASDQPSHAADNQSCTQGTMTRRPKQSVSTVGQSATAFTVDGQPSAVELSTPDQTPSSVPVFKQPTLTTLNVKNVSPPTERNVK